MPFKIITTSLAITVCMTLSSAYAQEQEAPAEACKEDAAKLCPDVKPGQGRIAACLKEHKEDVSKACKKAVAEHRRAKRKEG